MKQLIYILFIFLITGICFTSCRSIKYVPVEAVKTEVQYKDRVQKDSIHIKDSIFMFMKGDTVFRDRWHTEYKDKIIRDTSYIHKTDSIQVPYPVEKALSRLQSLKMELGGWALGIIIVFALIAIGWLTYKMRKK